MRLDRLSMLQKARHTFRPFLLAKPLRLLLVFFAAVILFLQLSNAPSEEKGNHASVYEPPVLKNEKFVKGHRQGEIMAQVRFSDLMSGKPVVLRQDDPQITDYIWSKRHILPPSKLKYKLKRPKMDPSMGQSQYIRSILKGVKNGFFVECGALDGETRSNTLYLEVHLGWKGLLVEGNPSNFELLKKKNRKAWIANTCLAVKPFPHMAPFHPKFNVGKILSPAEMEKHNTSYVNVQCLPLFTLLTAINVTTVDYFSLDVEGNELQVLKTIPFEKLNIKIISVEYLHTIEGKDALLKYMESQGYKMINNMLGPHDYIFARNDVAIAN